MTARLHPDDLVELARTPHAFEAQVMCRALEAEGIKATVFGAYAQVWGGLESGTFVPATVMVLRSDRRRARTALARIRAEAKGLPPPVEVASERAVTAEGACATCGYDMTGTPEATVCPECGVSLLDDVVEELRLEVDAQRRRRWFFVVGGVCVVGMLIVFAVRG